MPDARRCGSSLPGSTTPSLLDRVRAQDAEAWRRLVAVYGPLIYHWCRRQHLPAQDVADIFQEVWKSVAAHILTFRRDRPGDTFRGWLLTITQSKIADYRRRPVPQAAGGSDALRQLGQVPDPFAGQDDSTEEEQERGLLHRVLEALRAEFEEHTWQAFWRAVVAGQSPADIARDLGVSVNAVYKAKSRVLRRLREELRELAE